MTTAAQPATQPLGLFIPLVKVDVEQRLVYGVATAEEPDRSGEVCDYVSTKPYFETWSGDISKTTGGKSLGNVREMHGKSAAGKLTAINFDDAAKKIEVCAKVVDNEAWEKVLEGVYTGFSQGGRYVKRWLDEKSGLQRYTAEPSEISLVDLPCLPSATFSVIKAGGIVEQHAFKAPEAVMTTEAVIETPVVEKVEAEVEPEVAEVDGEQIALAKADPDGPQLVQFWKCGCEDHQHKTRKSASACQRETKAAEAAKAAAAPATEALGAIAGLLKGEKSGDEHFALAAGIEWSASDCEAVLKVFASDEVGKRAFDPQQRRDMATSGAAMKDGSFPIASKMDLENAVRAVGRAKDPMAAKKHIMARAKALGCEDCVPADWKPAAEKAVESASNLAKWAGEECHDAGRAVDILGSLHDLLSSEGWEDDQGGDQPMQAEHIRSAIGHVKDFAASELKENHDINDPAMALERAETALELAKRGARNSSADKARLQKCHDLMKDMGAECESTAGKAAHAGDESLAKAQAENAALREELAKIAPALDSIATMLKRAPLPARAAVNALGIVPAGGGVPASGDAQTQALELLGKMTPGQRADVLMRDTLRRPIHIPG